MAYRLKSSKRFNLSFHDAQCTWVRSRSNLTDNKRATCATIITIFILTRWPWNYPYYPSCEPWTWYVEESRTTWYTMLQISLLKSAFSTRIRYSHILLRFFYNFVSDCSWRIPRVPLDTTTSNSVDPLLWSIRYAFIVCLNCVWS